jgi:hypothetical protein
MAGNTKQSEAGTSVLALRRGHVVSVQEQAITVSLGESGPIQVNFRMTPYAPELHAVAVGDEVVVGCDARGFFLIGGLMPLGAEASDPPEHLLIEAKKSLTLRVGDGSITIREDGKILIKGKDLVSHAKRMNRIRGGSVAIN